MSKTSENFITQLEVFNENYDKFVNNGNKAAATRARKALSEISKSCKTLRLEIQETKNNM
jgi:hypothetical protein